MLLPENMAPENSIYYRGGMVLATIQEMRRASLSDLYCEVRRRYNFSFRSFLLCLDWLFLINCVKLENEEVVISS